MGLNMSCTSGVAHMLRAFFLSFLVDGERREGGWHQNLIP